MSTRYAEVARTLTAQIGDGTYPVGSLLPKEVNLAQTLGVSRSTVRNALQELQQLGLVSRRKSLGTRVEASRPVAGASDFAQTASTIDDLVQYGDMTRRAILEISDIVADQLLADQIGAAPGSRWLRVTHVRVDPGAPERPPICMTHVFIAEAYAAGVRERLPGHEGIISQLLEQVAGRRIQAVEQIIRAGGVPDAAAGPLKCATDDHALIITRRYLFSANALAEASVSVHPADRFEYTSRMKYGR